MSGSRPALLPEHEFDAGDFPWGLIAEVRAASMRDPILKRGLERDLLARLPQPFPGPGLDLDTLFGRLRDPLHEARRASAHPGLFCFISAPGLPTDPFAHALAAALNQNLVGFHSSPLATTIEKRVVGHFRALSGLPAEAGGLILPGGSTANLAALAVGLHRSLDWSGLVDGIAGGPRPVLLASEAAHFSVDRAARALGIGERGVLRIPVDTEFRMRVDRLETALQELAGDPDRVAACVVATAGTTATGAVDPLRPIGESCRRHGVWYHVDAAYGGAALMSPSLRPRLDGIELADSIIIDLHKWCYLAFDGSLLLYREPAAARRTWAARSDYLDLADPDRAEDAAPAETYTSFDLSPEVSRRFRALPAYLALLHYGEERFAANLEHNAACAEWLAQRVEASPDLERVAAPQLSTLCFRYRPPAGDLDVAELDRLNTAVVDSINDSGSFLLSHTRVQGRAVIRVCIRSHTTRLEHLERFLEAVLRAGRSAQHGSQT